MILKFAVRNFRSIKERIELDLNATSLKGVKSNISAVNNFKVLKSSVLYGPNASGKSNFILALRALEYLISDSSDFKPDETIGPYEPYLFEEGFDKMPTTIEIQFLSNGIKYDYTISFTDISIELEEMNYYPKSVKNLLFQRDRQRNVKFGDSYRGSKKQITKLLLENQLFLSKAAENNVESLLEPYRFFTSKLYVYSLAQQIDSESLSQNYVRLLAKNPDSSFSILLNTLVSSLDTGISGIDVLEAEMDNFTIPDHVPDEVKKELFSKYKYRVRCAHSIRNKKGSKAIYFDIDEESAGTRSLLEVGGLIIHSLLTGSVLVIDEIEKSLHPNITKYLVNLFNNPQVNKFQSQLIFSTHDITQLANDKLRRDQIWFVEKDYDGISSLTRCSDIKGIRLNTPLDKWYQTGRFGATPIIDDLDLIMKFQEVNEES